MLPEFRSAEEKPFGVYGLETLKQRFVVEGVLEAITQLHVGAGRGAVFGPDNPFVTILRGGKREPYIPGSSLKGALRAEAERIANALKSDLEAKTGEERRIVHSSIDIQCGDPYCIVCNVFGSQKQASHLRVQDSFLAEGQAASFEMKAGIAIDRVLSIVKPGALFNIQTLPPGIKFHFKMIIENLDKRSPEMRIVASLLEKLKDGKFQVGGKKSTGMGFVKLTDAKVHVYDARALYKGETPETKKLDDFIMEVFKRD